MAADDPTHDQTLWRFDAPRYYDFTKTEEENNHIGDTWFAQQNTTSSFFSHHISNTTVEIDQQLASSPKANNHEELGSPRASIYYTPVNYTTDAYLNSPSQRRHHSQEKPKRWDIKSELKKKSRHDQTQHLKETDQQQATEHWLHSLPSADTTDAFLLKNTDGQQPIQASPLDPSLTTQENTSQQHSQSPPPITQEHTGQPPSPVTQEHTDQQLIKSPLRASQEYIDQRDNQPSSITEEYTGQKHIQSLPPTNTDQEYTNNTMDEESEQGYRIVKLPILGVTIKSPISKPNTPRKSELGRSQRKHIDDTSSASRHKPVSASPLRLDLTKPRKKLPSDSIETKVDKRTESTDVSRHLPSDDEWDATTARKRPHSPDHHQQAPPSKVSKTSLQDPPPPSALLQLITQIKSHNPPPATKSPLMTLIAKVRSQTQSRAIWKRETAVERARRVLHEAHVKSKKWIVPLQRRHAPKHRLSIHPHRPQRYLTPAFDEKDEVEKMADMGIDLDDYSSWTTQPVNSYISPYLPVALTVPRSPKFATDKRMKRY